LGHLTRFSDRNVPDFQSISQAISGWYGERYEIANFASLTFDHLYPRKVPKIGDSPLSLDGITVLINGEERVKDMEVAKTAGGLNRAVDLVFNGVQPSHGVIELRFRNPVGIAAVQAIEVGPGDGGEGITPVPVTVPVPEK
jgi:hypothetical protein